MSLISQVSTSTNLSGLNGLKLSSPSASSDTKTDTAKSKADDLKNQFLGILLTQMKHQNPLDPMDTKEFTGQLTQFSALEQQIDSNSKLDELISSLKLSAVSTAFNYINQFVEIKNTTSVMQDGAANWTYSIPQTAAEAVVKVTDANGIVLYQEKMKNTGGGSEIGAGTYRLNLKNSDLAKAQENGAVLNFTLTAIDKAGAQINPTVYTHVKVESIQSDNTGTYLQAGGILFAMGDVKKIVGAPSVSSTTA